MNDSVSFETHADFGDIFGKTRRDETAAPVKFGSGMRMGQLSKDGFTVSGSSQQLLDWFDSLTAAAGVKAHDTGADHVWFRFDVPSQSVTVTFKGVE